MDYGDSKEYSDRKLQGYCTVKTKLKKKNTRESKKALFSTDLGLVKSVLKKQKYSLLKITTLFWVLKEYLASP